MLSLFGLNRKDIIGHALTEFKALDEFDIENSNHMRKDFIPPWRVNRSFSNGNVGDRPT